MGQQQLLLIILVTIIVGIATVVAINVFGTSAATANRDSVRQDMLVISSTAQGYFIKPTMMGGGGNSFVGMNFNDFDFAAAFISTDGMTAVNMNGTYVLSGQTATSFRVTGYPASDPAYTGDETTPSTTGESMIADVTQGGITWTTQ